MIARQAPASAILLMFYEQALFTGKLAFRWQVHRIRNTGWSSARRRFAFKLCWSKISEIASKELDAWVVPIYTLIGALAIVLDRIRTLCTRRICLM
jgi:hypothetical protein